MSTDSSTRFETDDRTTIRARRASIAGRCEYCGCESRWRDDTGTVVCRRGTGCARRPAHHERRKTFESGRTRVLYKLADDWLSARALAAVAKLPQRVIETRLARGWTTEDAVSVPRRVIRGQPDATHVDRTPRERGRPKRWITVRGECLSVAQWAARCNRSRAALYALAKRRRVSLERVIADLSSAPN